MHPRIEGRDSFKFPPDGVMQIRGVVKEKELRYPTMLDKNGEECLIVVKDGKTTGLTFGRGTGIESFVRIYSDYGIFSTSMEVAIYPHSHRGGPFSDTGDSGPIVVDSYGRIVGLLTGGGGLTDSTDVSYLSPYYWVEERIKEVFPDSSLYPIVA